jgi:phosphoglycolate phosphatase
VVFDVDNTLFDWVAAWAPAFDAMLATLERHTGAHRDRWCRAFGRAHGEDGWTFGLNALDRAIALVAADGTVAPATAGLARADAADQFLARWLAGLVPYPGVRETIAGLAGRGDVVAALTESDAELTAWRLARLGIGHGLHVVYGSRRPGAATDAERAALARTSAGVAVPDHRCLPEGVAKPDAEALRSVMRDLEIGPSRTICVGDNLGKDVRMAAAAGAEACWARYGAARDEAQARLLEQVAHWSGDAVSAERAVTVADLGAVRVIADPRELLDEPWRAADAGARGPVTSVSRRGAPREVSGGEGAPARREATMP